MAKGGKKQSGDSEFLLFNVLYEDGAQTSNRKVARSELSGFSEDDDEIIRRVLEEQDAKIAAMSGKTRGPIKTITPVDGRR
ncbi:MAG: hypothetical protein ACK4NA_05960 [Alphaproteobacteria bacterium]